MKKVLVMLLIISCMSALCESSAAEDWEIISGRSVGWISIGERIEKVQEFFGETQDRMGALYWYKSEGLEFYAPGHQIERIIIVKHDGGKASYATSSGISVGSSDEEVIRAYGEAERALYSQGEYVLNYFERGITFFIKNGVVSKILLYKRLGSCG